MKGQASGILAILLMLMVVWFVSASLNLTFQGGFTITKKIDLQQDLYSMSNALGAASLYMHTALKYSACQAIFDYGSEKKEDSNTGKLVASVSEKTLSNLNKYTSESYRFLSESYRVALPKYKKVDIEPAEKLAITATADSNFLIEKESQQEKTRLEKTAGLKIFFNYPSLRYIDALSPDSLNAHVQKLLEKEFKISGSKKLEGCGNKNTLISDLDVFNEAGKSSFASWKEAEAQLVGSVESGILDMAKNLSTGNVSSSAKLETTEAKIGRSCKTKIEDKCDQPEKSFSSTKTCDFSHTYSGKAIVSIEDKSSTCPVKTTEGESEKILFKNHFFTTTNSISLAYPA